MEKDKKRISIAVDMDGVLADTETHFIRYYEKETGEKIDPDSMKGIPENEAFPDKTAVQRFVRMPGFFRTLPLIPGGVDAIRTLMEDFDVYIVSAAMEFPLSLFEKKEWLEEYFPFISWQHIVFCGDKRIIRTDYLIDDHLKNLDHFQGVSIMFTASHNIHYSHHQRLNNWEEIVQYFKKLC
ncbi:MAG: 5'(3')-deoxyribonucleotidase [Bacteroidota bacterium]|nr:5'(3')-deoxyribonucleotidase [Bacteroidota bacterium]MDP4213327.1 5'(3')-deoxyribonucleotidase [Bacteroidota bacterium]MDP4251895.1 5'(3')-deoxyribonucleotidase [Bacteroidota bacterium]